MAERWIVRLLAAPALLALIATVASDAVTDRFAFAQSAWWVPRIPVLIGAALWFFAVGGYTRWRLRDARAAKRLSWLGAATAVFVLLHFLSMWGFPKTPREGAFRVVHWNASFIEDEFAHDAVRQLLELNADAIILTDAGAPVLSGGIEQFTSAGYMLARPGRFTVLSRVAIIEARSILAERSRFVSRVRLQTSLGELVIETLDLPSHPSIPRTLSMRSLSADLAAVRATLPDLMIGDFNITRGSHSLTLLAPDAVEAFAVAGSGWGGSFPRTKPLWSIDLALVREPWSPVRSHIIDFGFGRHRVQVIDLVRSAAQ